MFARLLGNVVFIVINNETVWKLKASIILLPAQWHESVGTDKIKRRVY